MVKEDRIGVVTVTYNGETVLGDFFRCTLAQTHEDFILYCIDNASKDGTREQLTACNDLRVRVVLNDANVGVAEGNNQGIRAAMEDGCEYILLLNNDVTYDRDMYQQLLAGLHKYRADMVCPKIRYFEPANKLWAAGGELQPRLGYRSRHFGSDVIDDGSYNTPLQVSYVPTCCVLMHRSVIERIGMMDPLYFVYVDDTDFMYRAHQAGLKLMYLPHILLAHKVGGSTGGKESPFTVRYCTRNRVYYLLKHFGFVGGLPSLLLYQAYFWYRLVLKGDTWGNLMHRQRSFCEGFKVYKTYMESRR